MIVGIVPTAVLPASADEQPRYKVTTIREFPMTYDIPRQRFSEGLAVARINVESHSKFGFVNTMGEVVIPFEYDRADDFSEGLAAVGVRLLCEEGEFAGYDFGYINTSGEVVIPIGSGSELPFSDGLAAVLGDDNLWGYIDTSGEFVIPPQFSTARAFNGGFATVIRNDVSEIIDQNGETVFAFEGNFIPVGVFSDDGLVAVRVNEWGGKYGFANTSGEVVIPLEYDFTTDFSEGFAGVRNYGQDGGGGLINTSGELVVPLGFGTVQSFNGGVARIIRTTQGEDEGFMNSDGEIFDMPNSDVENIGGGFLRISTHGNDGSTHRIVDRFNEVVHVYSTDYHSGWIFAEKQGNVTTFYRAFEMQLGRRMEIITITEFCDVCNDYDCECGDTSPPEVCDDCEQIPCDCPEVCECGCCSECGECGECEVCDPPVVGCGDCGDCSDCNPTPEPCDICENDPCDCPEVCDCLNCPDCGYLGGRFGFGKVTNNPTGLVVQDAIAAILRRLLELPSALDERD
jgi:hypothetical protein